MSEHRYGNDPNVIAARSDMAAIYRKLRKTDLTIARLLYVRTKAAHVALASSLIDSLYTTGSGSSLHDL